LAHPAGGEALKRWQQRHRAIDGCVETLALSNDKGFPFIQI